MTSKAHTHLRKLKLYSKRYFKFDFIAAVVGFLVAIPLCLGISLASGVPFFTGLLSAVIGGIIVGSISGSQVSISGPAAGMAAVVITAVAEIGDFNGFLLALMLAGILQIVMGIFKAGFIADYVPANVIQGLICAIGILLIIKQLPLAFTHSNDFNELKTHLLETTEGISLSPILALKNHINIGAMLITFLSIATLVYLDRPKRNIFKSIPAPIIVVVGAVVLNELFLWTDTALIQDSPHLVNIPSTTNLHEFIGQLQFPDWHAWSNPRIYISALMISMVASLEALMNFKGGERLDKKKRHSSTNQELVAQGFGNLTAGLIGGIPITSVIVRTSINIESGVRSKFSAILQGFFILAAFTLLPGALNKIPLSSLAAILIYTGYKLNKPKLYLKIFKQGADRFMPFIVTVISIIAFNVLTGILVGLTCSLFYILRSNSLARIDIIKEIYPKGETSRLILPQQMTFLNKAPLIAELNSMPKYSRLIIDARHTQFIDKEILELLKEFRDEQAPSKHIALNLTGFKDQYDIHDYIDFINVTTYDVQTTLTPAQVLRILHEGNVRFLQDTRIHRANHQDVKLTARTQHPIAVVLGCIDSRVPVETIFDMSFGDIFCIRIAGNVVNDDILASIEYACNVVGAKLILVLGHSGCGAIQSACNGIEKGHITQLLAKIKPAIEAETSTTSERNGSNLNFVKHVTKLNVANTLKDIYVRSGILRTMIDSNEIAMAGSVYDVHSGKVYFNNYAKELKNLIAAGCDNLPVSLANVLKEAKIN